MMDTEALVCVVDDDASLRESLQDLLGSVGLQVAAFASAQEFLRSTRPEGPSCLVLDVRLPGVSGLELQQRLAAGDMAMPIIFITGHGDIPMSVQAMKAGAVEFLPKPFREQDLLDAVHQALARDRQARARQAELAALRRRFDALTPRQRDVMAHMAAGLLNKQIAGALGTSEATVKTHRKQVMAKMQAESLADLIRIADQLGLLPPKS
jgi:FixJ family two-component response regulator